IEFAKKTWLNEKAETERRKELLLEKNSALFHVGGDCPDRTLICRFSGFSTLPTTGGFFDRSSV
ncbi:hypothetical protein IAG15_20580, partial [Enterococcus faecalis]|nr:hypothetical protein [Enterococcus faecalis]